MKYLLIAIVSLSALGCDILTELEGQIDGEIAAVERQSIIEKIKAGAGVLIKEIIDPVINTATDTAFPDDEGPDSAASFDPAMDGETISLQSPEGATITVDGTVTITQTDAEIILDIIASQTWANLIVDANGVEITSDGNANSEFKLIITDGEEGDDDDSDEDDNDDDSGFGPGDDDGPDDDDSDGDKIDLQASGSISGEITMDGVTVAFAFTVSGPNENNELTMVGTVDGDAISTTISIDDGDKDDDDGDDGDDDDDETVSLEIGPCDAAPDLDEDTMCVSADGGSAVSASATTVNQDNPNLLFVEYSEAGTTDVLLRIDIDNNKDTGIYACGTGTIALKYDGTHVNRSDEDCTFAIVTNDDDEILIEFDADVLTLSDDLITIKGSANIQKVAE